MDDGEGPGVGRAYAPSGAAVAAGRGRGPKACRRRRPAPVPSPAPASARGWAPSAPSWWTARATEGEVTPGFTKDEILRPRQGRPARPRAASSTASARLLSELARRRVRYLILKALGSGLQALGARGRPGSRIEDFRICRSGLRSSVADERYAPPARRLAPSAWPSPWPSPSCRSPPRCARGEIIEQILVKVNGDIITKTDLEARAGGGAAPARRSRT